MSNGDQLRSNINGLSGFPLLRFQWHNDNDDDLGGTMNCLRNFLRVLACTLLVSALPSGFAYAGDNDDGDRHHGDHAFKIDVLSSRPYMVSGGDALVRVTVKKKDVSLGSVRIELNGANITGAFRSLPAGPLPTDVATTATGVPYIVRLETGTINRAIYQTAILHNPNDAAPSPFSPPAGWNKRLVFPLGGGCIGGWYFQGSDIESVVNHSYLNLGYAVAASTLTTFGNNCNDLLSSETVIMVKERFVESYGVPLFTIGTGGSGGAYQSNQTGDNYPGTFDGIVTTSSFPDVTTGMLPMGNSRLLDIYFNKTRPGVYSVAQQKAISGYLSIPGMINHMSNVRGPRMDPRVEFPDQILAGVGTDRRYDPATNSFGAR